MEPDFLVARSTTLFMYTRWALSGISARAEGPVGPGPRELFFGPTKEGSALRRSPRPAYFENLKKALWVLLSISFTSRRPHEPAHDDCVFQT